MPILTLPLATYVNIPPITQSSRRLVLIDQTCHQQVWCEFDHPFDSTQSKFAVAEMFDATLSRLRDNPQHYFTNDQLPILQHLGFWSVTILTRQTNGLVTLCDGQDTPVDAYMSTS